MTTLALSAKTKRPPNLGPHKRAAVVAAIAATAMVALAIAGGLHLELLFRQPLVIQIHVYAAITALGLGGVLLLARKGRAFHIRAGWTWAALMTVVAGSALFITGINGDWWSWIHILSGSTLFTLPFAIMAIRKKNIRAHRAAMLSLYVGGMMIAGGFTFLPGRLMWRVVFG